jgi:hypothetical protein
VTTTLAWWSSRSSRLTAVVCSGRKRPHWSKGQWLAMPRARRSQAAATRNSSWAPVSSRGANPTSSSYADFRIAAPMPTRELCRRCRDPLSAGLIRAGSVARGGSGRSA